MPFVEYTNFDKFYIKEKKYPKKIFLVYFAKYNTHENAPFKHATMAIQLCGTEALLSRSGIPFFVELLSVNF